MSSSDAKATAAPPHLVALVVNSTPESYDCTLCEDGTPGVHEFAPAQQDALNKLMSLLDPEGVSYLASQGPEGVNARLKSFSRYENALLEHVQETMSAATATASATREGSTRPKPL
ncbi:hypothetical protein PC129_g21464 [Phytophthora cactorum]|uniref:Uncharacterized protein n=1 Tax=Phytophthora cactorum TaxID=29920 RepID=A0A8T1H636_9STRA|nr:hypothetical protein Pcac1_g24797 [Phytophthora cactorum]KAG2875644.1 hypothetical protein PC114_g24606 [Phytophthora cactorum]KAG2882506.1 hypothetical protein PC115_g21927 [Phytophthora cactorum]KAG2890494.1 hypothetical protein PC117_g24449 [Phytophthora cactorum]KAG2961331.1 hypothetical protein PC118_g22028 [Phytophthora cactorum]